jgi:hypothetical protein
MRSGKFEKDVHWVGGAVNDIIQSAGEANKVVGVFEIGYKLTENNTRSRGELLQELRRRIIALGIYGDHPAIKNPTIQGKAPLYAQGDVDVTNVHYRRLTEKDIPQWPGIITFSKGEADESV